MHRLFRVGDRHRAEGVAVIAVGEAEETVFPGFPHVSPVLQRDLERDLDGDRPGIREEDTRQSRRAPAPSAGSASRSAGSCTRPPNITCGIVSSCRATHSRICG